MDLNVSLLENLQDFPLQAMAGLACRKLPSQIKHQKHRLQNLYIPSFIVTVLFDKKSSDLQQRIIRNLWCLCTYESAALEYKRKKLWQRHPGSFILCTETSPLCKHNLFANQGAQDFGLRVPEKPWTWKVLPLTTNFFKTEEASLNRNFQNSWSNWVFRH